MVDRYYRKIESVENEIENSIQISGILLKLKEHNDLSNNNKNKLEEIENHIFSESKNYQKKFNIDSGDFDFNRDNNYYTLLNEVLNYEFTINSLIHISCDINYKYVDVVNNYFRLQHEYNIYDDEDNLLNRFLFNHDKYYNNSDELNTNEYFYIYFKKNYSKLRVELVLHRINRYGSGTINLSILNGYVDVNYLDKNISLSLNDVINDVDVNKNDLNNVKDDINNVKKNLVVNKNDLNNVKDDINNVKKNLVVNKNDLNNVKDDVINVKKDLYNVNNTLDNVKLDINNVKKDLDNVNDELDTSYKLKNIYTFDIKSKSQFVDKNKPFHIFEQNIVNNFKKDSFLEVSIKVLTEISNYILIGFFEILCEFFNENNDLFYDISLSTAMGSINRLSTVKSIFIVPIDRDMTKIKIDFYIRPKLSQQSRSASYKIIDINSNKIYIKYFQK